MFTADDHAYMARALRLAARGLYTTDPNPRVGCVLVRDGRIVGEGWHRRAGEAHAEIEALEMAGENAAGATVYVTLEPCAHHGRTPPCSDALIQAGVREVIAAMRDPNPRVDGGGFQRLALRGIRTRHGLLEDAARALNPGFVSRMTLGRPLLRSKLAMSLDGRTAMRSGESQWITGPDARRDVQRLRARSGAILTGIGTVLADNPSMRVRAAQIGEPAPDGGWRQPLRVVVDSRLRCPPDAAVLQGGPCLLAGAVNDPEKTEKLTTNDVNVVTFPAPGGGVDLHALVRRLGELEINEVLIEAGPTLNGALLQAGLLDELVIYMAPTLMGSEARGLFNLPGLDAMRDRIGLRFTDTRSVGRDLRISARIEY